MSKFVVSVFHAIMILVVINCSTSIIVYDVPAVRLKCDQETVSASTNKPDRHIDFLEKLQSVDHPITSYSMFFDPDAFDEVSAMAVELVKGYQQSLATIRADERYSDKPEDEILADALTFLIGTLPFSLPVPFQLAFRNNVASVPDESHLPVVFQEAVAFIKGKNATPAYKATVHNLRNDMEKYKSVSDYFDKNGMTLVKGQDASAIVEVLDGERDPEKQGELLKSVFPFDSGIVGSSQRHGDSAYIYKFGKESTPEQDTPTFLVGEVAGEEHALSEENVSEENVSSLKFETDPIRRRSYTESVVKSVKQAIPSAEYVFVMQQAVRSTEIFEPADSFSTPAPLIHADYSPDKMLWIANRMMLDIDGKNIFEDEGAPSYQENRRREISFANVWRNARDAPILDEHLSLCKKNSVQPGDVDLSRYPYDSKNNPLKFARNPPVEGLSTMMFVPSEETAEICSDKSSDELRGIHGNPKHEWVYAPSMTNDEVLVFLQGKAEVFENDIRNAKHTDSFEKSPENHVVFHAAVKDRPNDRLRGEEFYKEIRKCRKDFVNEVFDAAFADRADTVVPNYRNKADTIDQVIKLREESGLDFGRVSIESRVMVLHYEGYSTNGVAETVATDSASAGGGATVC